MAKAVVLEVEPRGKVGKGEARKLRATGLLPGVIYGPGIQAQSLSVPRRDLIQILHAHGMHALVSLKVSGGGEFLALVKEVQVHAVRQEALHVDFHRVEEDKPVHTTVAVEIMGIPAGVKLGGGILEVQTRSLSIEALPLDIPETIVFDVSALEIGDVARIGDLDVPPGVTVLSDPDETLCTVAAPRVEEEKPAELSEEELAALAEAGEAPEDAGTKGEPDAATDDASGEGS